MNTLQIVGIALAIVVIIAIIAYIYRPIDLSKARLLPSGFYNIYNGLETFDPLAALGQMDHSTDVPPVLSTRKSFRWDAFTATLTWYDFKPPLVARDRLFLYELPDKRLVITSHYRAYGPSNFSSLLKEANMNMPLFWNYN